MYCSDKYDICSSCCLRCIVVWNYNGAIMIISERQIMQLIRIAEAFCHTIHRFGEYKSSEEIQGLLATINDQQSEELKVIE